MEKKPQDTSLGTAVVRDRMPGTPPKKNPAPAGQQTGTGLAQAKPEPSPVRNPQPAPQIPSKAFPNEALQAMSTGSLTEIITSQAAAINTRRQVANEALARFEQNYAALQQETIEKKFAN